MLKQQIKNYEDFKQDSWEEARTQEREEKSSILDEMYNEMKAYNEKIYREGQKNLSDPFAYEKPSMNLERYGIADNMIAYINIPRMKIELPIYLGATKENMKKGAAQLSETSLPIGGPNTNTVIAAHRGMTSKEMFRHIDKLQLGDEITITNFWYTLSYKVVEIKIIKPHEIEKILIQEGRETFEVTGLFFARGTKSRVKSLNMYLTLYLPGFFLKSSFSDLVIKLRFFW